MKRGLRVSLAGILLMAASLARAAPAAANGIEAVIHVDSNLDNATGANGPCTLREAINNANANADTTGGDCEAGVGIDEIQFAGNYTITLNSQLPDVTGVLYITGNGLGNTIIQANINPNAATYRLFYVAGAAILTLDGVTIQNGRCVVGCAHDAYSGGAIYVSNGASLTVKNSLIQHNHAAGSSGGVGGAIVASSATSLSIQNSTFYDNSAVSGGAVMAFGTTTVSDSLFNQNGAQGYTGGFSAFGGGIYNDGNLTVSGSTFNQNGATHTSEITGYAGAIWNSNSGSTTISDSTFSMNSADLGGAIYAYDGTLEVTRSTFENNSTTGGVGSGGAIYAQQSPTVNITNSTFGGNSASYGSGVNVSNAAVTLTVVNSTFSVNGTGPAIGMGDGTLNLKNTILANTTGGVDCYLGSATMGADVNNLIEFNDVSYPCGTPFGTGDPRLAYLAANGGPTRTFALRQGSGALGSGDSTTCSNSSGSPSYGAGGVDQRGAARPLGSACEIGAYEAPGGSSVGIYDSAWFYLRNLTSPGPADATFQFGWNGPIPLVGIWDNSGSAGVGLDDNGWFFLRNAPGPGPADNVFQYGWAGAVPVFGDWNDDGMETVGIYDSGSGTYFLRNSNSPGPADMTFSFGWGGAIPLSGDWDADGVDSIGFYHPASGTFFLRNSNSAGPADYTFTFAWANLKPLVGDWNQDGADSIGVYDPASGTFFLRNFLAAGPADSTFGYGWPGATPLSGVWDIYP